MSCPKASKAKTCKEAADETAAMFAVGDVVRLKSERREMTVIIGGCSTMLCAWFNGDELCQDEFHREALTKEPYPQELPF